MLIRLQPDSPMGHSWKGWVLCVRKEWQRALPYLDKAITTNSNGAENYINRGNAYYHLGRINEAKTDIQHAFELSRVLLAEESKDDDMADLRKEAWYQDIVKRMKAKYGM